MLDQILGCFELLPLLDKLVVTKRAEPSIAAAVLKFKVAAPEKFKVLIVNAP